MELAVHVREAASLLQIQMLRYADCVPYPRTFLR